MDAVTHASGFLYRLSFEGGLGRCTGAVLCGRGHLSLHVGGRHTWVPCVCACACYSWLHWASGLPGAFPCASPSLAPSCPPALLALLRARVAVFWSFGVRSLFSFLFLWFFIPPARSLRPRGLGLSLVSSPGCPGPWGSAVSLVPPFLLPLKFRLGLGPIGLLFVFVWPPCPLLFFPFSFFSSSCGFFCSPRPPALVFVLRVSPTPLLGAPCAPAVWQFFFPSSLAVPLRLLPPCVPGVYFAGVVALPLGVPPPPIFCCAPCALCCVLSPRHAGLRSGVLWCRVAMFSAACRAVVSRLAVLWAAWLRAVFFGAAFCVLFCWLMLCVVPCLW